MSVFQNERWFLISYAVFQSIALVSPVINDFLNFVLLLDIHDNLGEKLKKTDWRLGKYEEQHQPVGKEIKCSGF